MKGISMTPDPKATYSFKGECMGVREAVQKGYMTTRTTWGRSDDGKLLAFTEYDFTPKGLSARTDNA